MIVFQLHRRGPVVQLGSVMILVVHDGGYDYDDGCCCC